MQHFADTRVLLGIPNLVNVLSCLPLVLAGGFGLGHVVAERQSAGGYCISGVHRAVVAGLFVAVVGTGFGWSYFHVDPAGRFFWQWAPALTTIILLGAVAVQSTQYTRRRQLVVAAGILALGLIAAVLDHTIFGLGRVVSGHTVMHVLVGIALGIVARYVAVRRAT